MVKVGVAFEAIAQCLVEGNIDALDRSNHEQDCLFTHLMRAKYLLGSNVTCDPSFSRGLFTTTMHFSS